MKVMIQFYRVRDVDEAQAVVGRETAEAVDLDDAIEIARRLWKTLDMPQRPDGVAVFDSEGIKLYSGAFERIENIR